MKCGIRNKINKKKVNRKKTNGKKKPLNLRTRTIKKKGGRRNGLFPSRRAESKNQKNPDLDSRMDIPSLTKKETGDDEPTEAASGEEKDGEVEPTEPTEAADGAQGPLGPTGADGAQGPQGPTGADGAQGPLGPQGPTGADEAQGPQGPTGADEEGEEKGKNEQPDYVNMTDKEFTKILMEQIKKLLDSDFSDNERKQTCNILRPKFHPDKNKGPKALERSKILNNICELIDSKNKSELIKIYNEMARKEGLNEYPKDNITSKEEGKSKESEQSIVPVDKVEEDEESKESEQSIVPVDKVEEDEESKESEQSIVPVDKVEDEESEQTDQGENDGQGEVEPTEADEEEDEQPAENTGEEEDEQPAENTGEEEDEQPAKNTGEEDGEPAEDAGEEKQSEPDDEIKKLPTQDVEKKIVKKQINKNEIDQPQPTVESQPQESVETSTSTRNTDDGTEVIIKVKIPSGAYHNVSGNAGSNINTVFSGLKQQINKNSDTLKPKTFVDNILKPRTRKAPVIQKTPIKIQKTQPEEITTEKIEKISNVKPEETISGVLYKAAVDKLKSIVKPKSPSLQDREKRTKLVNDLLQRASRQQKKPETIGEMNKIVNDVLRKNNRVLDTRTKQLIVDELNRIKRNQLQRERYRRRKQTKTSNDVLKDLRKQLGVKSPRVKPIDKDEIQRLLRNKARREKYRRDRDLLNAIKNAGIDTRKIKPILKKGNTTTRKRVRFA